MAQTGASLRAVRVVPSWCRSAIEKFLVRVGNAERDDCLIGVVAAHAGDRRTGSGTTTVAHARRG